MKKLILFLLFAVMLFQGCLEENKKTIVVFNKPLKGIVKEIVGYDYNIEVLAESDIHNFQLSPKKALLLKNSVLYVGIDRELEDFSPPENSLYMSDYIERGDNIHYWTDPLYSLPLAKKISEKLGNKYSKNYKNFEKKVYALDEEIREMFKEKRKEYVITHDSMYYFNKRYGLKSYYLFSETSTSTFKISEILNMFREGRVKLIAREKQFPKSRIDFLREKLDNEGITYREVEINILEENYLEMIEKNAKKIAENI